MTYSANYRSLLLTLCFLAFTDITAVDGRGYCRFPSFLWRQHQQQQQPHQFDSAASTDHDDADSSTAGGDSSLEERRWLERYVHGAGAGGKATTSTTTRELQREISVRPTEIWTEQRVQTACGGGSSGGGLGLGVGGVSPLSSAGARRPGSGGGPASTGGAASGRLACYRREAVSSYVCLAEEPMGKYRVLETDRDGQKRFSCIKFVLRNQNVVQIYRAAEPEDWAPCSIQGGFDFSATTLHSDERLCSSSWRPSRMESECIRGDGLSFYFPQPDCSLFHAPSPLDRFHCLAVWEEDLYRFIVFGSPKSQSRYVLRTPASVEKLDEFVAELYLNPHAPLNNTDPLSQIVTGYHLHMLRSEPGVCFDESGLCQHYASEGRCTSAAVHQYANYCKYSCGLCEFAPSAKAECTFAGELQGYWVLLGPVRSCYWVLFSDTEREEIAIEGGEIRFSTLGRFICKGKHWEEDYYKVFSVFTNGCRPRYSCLRLSRGDGDTLLFNMSPSDLSDRSFELCEFNDAHFPSSNRLRSWRSKVLLPLSSMLHSGCGVNGLLRADAEFSDGLACSGGSIADVTWKQDRCEQRPALSLSLGDGCTTRLDLSRYASYYNRIEFRCASLVQLSNSVSFLVSQRLPLNVTRQTTGGYNVCWLIRDIVDEKRQRVTELSRARCDTAHSVVLPRSAAELTTIRVYRDSASGLSCVQSSSAASLTTPSTTNHVTDHVTSRRSTAPPIHDAPVRSVLSDDGYLRNNNNNHPLPVSPSRPEVDPDWPSHGGDPTSGGAKQSPSSRIRKEPDAPTIGNSSSGNSRHVGGHVFPGVSAAGSSSLRRHGSIGRPEVLIVVTSLLWTALSRTRWTTFGL